MSVMRYGYMHLNCFYILYFYFNLYFLQGSSIIDQSMVIIWSLPGELTCFWDHPFPNQWFQAQYFPFTMYSFIYVWIVFYTSSFTYYFVTLLYYKKNFNTKSLQVCHYKCTYVQWNLMWSHLTVKHRFCSFALNEIRHWFYLCYCTKTFFCILSGF